MERHKPFKELKDLVRHNHISDAKELAKQVLEEHKQYKHVLHEGPLYKVSKALLMLDEKYQALGKAFDSLHRDSTRGSCCEHDEYHEEQIKGRDDI